MSKRSIRKRRHLPLCGDERVPGLVREVVVSFGPATVSGVGMRALVAGDAPGVSSGYTFRRRPDTVVMSAHPGWLLTNPTVSDGEQQT